jgi:hypothetical protein
MDHFTKAATDVLNERVRQVDIEGWTPEHDDQHGYGQMAGAAACYALQGATHWATAEAVTRFWPWEGKWWKPTTVRSSLVKAAALLIAEIERIDRAEARK